MVLSRYADRFVADGERWLFLTGEKETIHRLVREGFRLSLVDLQEERKDPGHSMRFVLVDRQARIRGYYNSREEEALQRLREHVRILLREE